MSDQPASSGGGVEPDAATATQAGSAWSAGGAQPVTASSSPSQPSSAAGSPLEQRPELAVGGAFAGGLVLALILKRLAK